MNLNLFAEDRWLCALMDRSSRLTLPTDTFLGRWTLGQWLIPRRTLSDHLLYWLVQGGVQGEVAGQPVQASAGSLIWVMPGVVHQFQRAAGSPALVLYNLRFRLEHRQRLLRLPTDCLHVTRSVDLEAPFATVVDEIQQPGRHGTAMLKAALAQLAVRIFRAAERPADAPPVLNRFQRDRLARRTETQAHLRLTPADLARELELSPDYFARIFRRTYGLSPRAWLVRQRIRLAAVKLAQTTANISEIARELGYDEVFLFSRQFKQVLGHSPRAHRLRAAAATSRRPLLQPVRKPRE